MKANQALYPEKQFGVQKARTTNGIPSRSPHPLAMAKARKPQVRTIASVGSSQCLQCGQGLERRGRADGRPHQPQHHAYPSPEAFPCAALDHRLPHCHGQRPHTITRKPLDFEQVDRECNWDDQILLTTLIFYTMNAIFPWASHLPWWNTKGVVLLALIHMGPVEFIYYWFHRALHHHLLYSRYHSHHHASVVTQPITSVIHPFAEELAYFVLFSIPLITIAVTGTGSVTAMAGYLMFIDFMNYLGHCNFEVVPNWLFDVFPLLKYLMYTPSFHSLHHTQFRTNYCLFMPLYDFIYGTVDKSSKKLYQSCIVGIEEAPDVVHLTHMTNLESIYHLRMGSASLSSKPYSPKWYMWLLWPLTLASLLVTLLCGSIFIVEKNRMKKLVVETWAIPRFSFQYKRPSQRVVINGFIEKAVLDAEKAGAKMITFGLLNQGDELNAYGKLYIQNNPQLKIKIVDGTSLAAAVVLNSIPKGTKQALLWEAFPRCLVL
ncbi:hypothetical protein HPP92_021777 [Vanilla planifolia]|uniref:aldehyde oxygenase (deformylating) n=1 Tax=Vanilla planifolia TaxID=51239 RepID=A0A835UD79_VANPL|nr:hypothetical protein HPP92_021777 [Vanilla planifolia]